MRIVRTVLLVGVAGAGLLALGVGGTVAWAYATGDARTRLPDAPYPTIVASTDPAVIEQGRTLVWGAAHCASCHVQRTDHESLAYTPELPLAGGLELSMGPMGTYTVANLTSDPGTGLGALTDGEIARVIRDGVMPDGRISPWMRYSAARPSDTDLVAILSYLRSLPPVVNEIPPASAPALPLLTLLLPLPEPFVALSPGVPPSDTPSVERGRYVVENLALCTSCHRTFDMETWKPLGAAGAGGDPIPGHPPQADQEFVPPNLLRGAGFLSRTDEDGFVDRFRHGRVHAGSPMPWEDFSRMPEADLRSVYRYLASLPPSDQDLGPTVRPLGSAG